jgi:hypothetical protein
MNKKEIIEKIIEMIYDLDIEDQLEILDESKIEAKEQWDEMCSNAWEGYVP